MEGGIKDKKIAGDIHYNIGKEVREAIERIGGKHTPSGADTPAPPLEKGNESGDTGHQNQIPLWTADIDYTQMSIGDKRRTSDGRIWEAIDLG